MTHPLIFCLKVLGKGIIGYKESGVAMKELELLGLQNDGEHLTLNDAEGNRYSLEITSELRALLRHDVAYETTKEGQARPVTPREIQAYVRAGKTIVEISELTSMPPSQIESLAHPIINERNYTARRARALPTTRDPGSLTLEELVATRLASRGVKIEDVEWDAIRKAGEPWTVIARYESAERERQAIWYVDLSKRSLEAISEEAVWLSETPLLPQSDVWRAPNTPPLKEDNSADSPGSVSSLPSAPDLPSAPTPEDKDDIKQASISRIDAVLADLDARRGVPTDKEHYSSLIEAEAANALESAQTPEDDDNATDTENEQRETIFDLPVYCENDSPEETNKTSPESSASENDAPQQEDLFSSTTSTDASLNVPEQADNSDTPSSRPQKKIRRSDRPTMPTFEEILYGKKN